MYGMYGDLIVVSSMLSCLGEEGIQPNQSFPTVRVDEVLLILGYICVLVQKLRIRRERITGVPLKVMIPKIVVF